MKEYPPNQTKMNSSFCKSSGLTRLQTFVCSINRILNRLWVFVALALVLTACDTREKRAYQTFVDSAKASVNPQLLQQQMLPLLSQYAGRSEVPVSELPPEAKKLSELPPVASIGTWNDSKEEALMIAWGNGFAHWGVIVGTPMFHLPKVDYLTVTEWSPGVGFFFQK